MGFFSRKKEQQNKPKEPYGVVFICRGPDPTGLTNLIENFSMTDRGLYEMLMSLGYTGPREHVIMYGPDWNKTVYSSYRLQEEGEVDDLLAKIKSKLNDRGFIYSGEEIRTVCYDPSTNYGKMGFFAAYLFIDK